MASVLTGTIVGLKIDKPTGTNFHPSAQTITGSSGELGEATVTLGKQRGKFDPTGTDVSMHTTGMKTVEGTMSKRWVASGSGFVSGSGSLFQNLLDNDTEFSITVSGTTSTMGRMTVSGCIAGERSVRVAPGTEVMMETLTFTGLDWGSMA